MAESVTSDQVLSLFERISRETSELTFPSLTSGTIRCRLGRGRTSDVFIVELGNGDDVVMKIPQKGYQKVIDEEYALMESLAKDLEELPGLKHFSRLYPGTRPLVTGAQRCVFCIPMRCQTEWWFYQRGCL